MEILVDIASKIGFDWKLSITHLINFLIIFFLLVKFALPGIKKVIADRTKKIEEGLKMRYEADKIVESAKTDAKEISKIANQKAGEIISKADENAKNIISDSSEKGAEIIRLANTQKEEAKNSGLKEAENLLAKDISKILAKISATAFDSKLTADNNSDFVTKVFKQNFSK
jgi:F-type H+-transporting ATPase subunit b